MNNSDGVVSEWEIFKNKLSFVVYKNDYKEYKIKKSPDICYLCVDNTIIYENFYDDFGPHHLNNLYTFCQNLFPDYNKQRVVFYTHDSVNLVLNAAYLIGSYLIIYENKSPAWIYSSLIEGDGKSRKTKFQIGKFIDVSNKIFISLLDVLKGVHWAFIHGFFNFDDYDFEEYEFLEKVVNADLNWIVPNKLLAFSGPHHRSQKLDDYSLHPPSHYHKYFRNNNVTTIVRLNMKAYNASQFTNFGFEHFDLFFMDGTAPTLPIVHEFIKICEQAKGAVAVHCKAGLGRTGTLIACYMMKHHAFTAHQAIAWLRICRPGSVIGCQQNFLEDVEAEILAEGTKYRKIHRISSLPTFKCGIYSLVTKRKQTDIENDNILESNPVTSEKGTISSPTKHKHSPISLDSIINCNSSTMKTRSSTNQEKIENNKIDADIKHSIIDDVNKNSYPNHVVKVKSLTQTNKSGRIVKVHETITPSKMPSPMTTRLKTSEGAVTRSSAIMPTKSSLAKCRFTKGNAVQSHRLVNSINSNSRAVRRSNNENISISIITDSKEISQGSKTVTVTSEQTRPVRKKSPRNLSLIKEKYENTLSDLTLNTDCFNGSNSDSEIDSTNTTLTNISADSLENIPSKIPNTRKKMSSPEPMDQSPDVEIPEMSPNSQGNKLFEIKAMRKKTHPSNDSKNRIQTRSLLNGLLVKKK